MRSTAREREIEAQLAVHRSSLLVHCYRMTASMADADDCVQETLIRAWNAIDTLADAAALRAWLLRIATNVCLNFVKARARRRLPHSYGRPGDPTRTPDQRVLEPIWIEPLLGSSHDPELALIHHEDVSLALITVLQKLSPRQRAVFILRDSLGWPAEDVAQTLAISVASVKSALHRARTAVRAAKPKPAPLEKEQASLLRRFLHAFERHDVDAIVRLLADDAVLSMPPIPTWFRGGHSIGRFLRSSFYASRHAGGVRLVPTRANGQPAFAMYVKRKRGGRFEPHSIVVLTLERKCIARLHIFLDPGLVARSAAKSSEPFSRARLS